MKVKFCIIMLAIVLLFSGCGNTNKKVEKDSTSQVSSSSNSTQPKPIIDSGTIANEKSASDVILAKAKELIKNYEDGLILAINKNNFSKVENYLTTDSELYKAQKELVRKLFSQGIKEKMVSYETGRLYGQSEPNTYKFEVIEKIEIQYPKKSKETKDFQWMYTINSEGTNVKLSKIEKWPTYEEDITKRQSNAKADGYYAEELINMQYDSYLLSKLNDISDTDELFENKVVEDKNSQIISSIKSKGKEFRIISSQIIKGNHDNSYSAAKKITLSYKDKSSEEKKASLLFTLDVKEYRVNSTLVYDGYAKITDIDNVKIE